MISFLVALLIFVLIVCVIAAIVAWILSNIPGMPPWTQRVVWAVAGIILLIWLLQHIGAVARL